MSFPPPKNEGDHHLSRRDITILKGVGILLIVLHNYFHWQPGLEIENEFSFAAAHFDLYLHHAFTGVVAFLRYTAAYFGHFGVEIFVFASGYGLYASTGGRVTTLQRGYLIPKLIKICALLLVGTLAIALIDFLNTGSAFGLLVLPLLIAARLSSIANFSYDTIFIGSGPFWFFGLIVQLYILFPLLARITTTSTLRTDVALVVLCAAVNAGLYPITLLLNVPLMGIFIGQLPAFLVGMLLAKHGYRFNSAALLGCAVLFALGQHYEIFYTATFPSVAYLIIAAWFAAKRLRGRATAIAATIMYRLGTISMAVFILNGPLRTMPLFRNESGDLETSRIFLFTAILILASIPLAALYKWTCEQLGGLYDRALGAGPSVRTQ